MNNKDGFALLTVMCFVLLVSVVGGMLIQNSNQQFHITRHRTYHIKAKNIAMGGINYTYSILKSDPDLISAFKTYDSINLNDGVFTCNSYPANIENICTIECNGTYRGVTASAAANIRLYQDNTDGSTEGSGWSYTLFVNNDIILNGSGNLTGKVFANNNIISSGDIDWVADLTAVNLIHLSGGSSTIIGTGTARLFNGPGIGGIQNVVVDSVDSINFPNIDLTQYYLIADANGQVRPGGDYTGSFGSVPGNVLWFTGDVTLQNVSYNGCLIATGNITTKGSFNQTVVGKLPAVISRDGYIHINGSHIIHGLIYSRQDTTVNSSGNLIGSIIVGGDLVLNGSYGDLGYEYSSPGTSSDETGTAHKYVSLKTWVK